MVVYMSELFFIIQFYQSMNIYYRTVQMFKFDYPI